MKLMSRNMVVYMYIVTLWQCALKGTVGCHTNCKTAFALMITILLYNADIFYFFDMVEREDDIQYFVN